MHPVRQIQWTPEFRRWARGLTPEQRAKVKGTIDLVSVGGPTLGRPNVDVIHGSKVDKLKEARVDHGTRVLFAFDSNRNLVMLVGGDKTGKWNRWYRPMIQRAERLYVDHERSSGKEVPCRGQRETRRTSSQVSR